MTSDPNSFLPRRNGDEGNYLHPTGIGVGHDDVGWYIAISIGSLRLKIHLSGSWQTKVFLT